MMKFFKEILKAENLNQVKLSRCIPGVHQTDVSKLLSKGRGRRKAKELNPEDAEAYSNRGVAYYYKGEYGKAWDDIHMAQSLGLQVPPGFLQALREASGRQE